MKYKRLFKIIIRLIFMNFTIHMKSHFELYNHELYNNVCPEKEPFDRIT